MARSVQVSPSVEVRTLPIEPPGIGTSPTATNSAPDQAMLLRLSENTS